MLNVSLTNEVRGNLCNNFVYYKSLITHNHIKHLNNKLYT